MAIAAIQYLHERRRRRQEAEREARQQATNLTAWTVTDAGELRHYGVRLSNTSGSTFHDVHIETVMHGSPVRGPIRLLIVPPGDYYIGLAEKNAPYPWQFARAVEEHDGALRPYMQTDQYRVTSMRFSDNLNQTWVTDDRAVLVAL
ncbi:hypothetical protein ACEXQB_012545 [Herbiconiux sp. P18]|uniref:hypothetical protein n=1 Tax=Herbiconiux liangxiaofengii TaxID=3342795 RepID=UPI0035B7B125